MFAFRHLRLILTHDGSSILSAEYSLNHVGKSGKLSAHNLRLQQRRQHHLGCIVSFSLFTTFFIYTARIQSRIPKSLSYFFQQILACTSTTPPSRITQSQASHPKSAWSPVHGQSPRRRSTARHFSPCSRFLTLLISAMPRSTHFLLALSAFSLAHGQVTRARSSDYPPATIADDSDNPRFMGWYIAPGSSTFSSVPLRLQPGSLTHSSASTNGCVRQHMGYALILCRLLQQKERPGRLRDCDKLLQLQNLV